MTSLEEAIARSAIHHTLSLYNNSGDRGRIDKLVSAFREDGVLELPDSIHRGRSQIACCLQQIAMESAATQFAGSRHHLTTSHVEFDDSTHARGWTYFLVVRNGLVIQEGIYIDQFAASPETWLIAHRRVKLIYENEANLAAMD